MSLGVIWSAVGWVTGILVLMFLVMCGYIMVEAFKKRDRH
jgi:hypothetical protein